jgi:hypothetical protein
LKKAAVTDVCNLFQSGLKLHTQRFKLRNIKNYCSFHRELIASPDFQESLTHSSAAVAANFKSSFEPTMEKLDDDVSLISLARIAYILEYTLVAMLCAYMSRTDAVQPQWYLAPLIILPIATLTTFSVGRRLVISQAILFSSRALALLLGVSSIIFGITILTNLSMVEDLTQVLQPGILGGILLLFINILYIPNAVVATLSYLAGSGFAIGSGTLVAPWSHRLFEIPAIPLLGAVPAEKAMWHLLFIVIIVAVGALMTTWTIQLSTRTLIQSYFLSCAMIVFLAFFSSGALITNILNSVGVSLWKFPLLIGAELGLGILLTIFIPRISLSNPFCSISPTYHTTVDFSNCNRG